MDHRDIGTLMELVKNNSFQQVAEALAGIAEHMANEASDYHFKDKAIALSEASLMFDEISEFMEV